MYSVIEETTSWMPQTDEDKEMIRQQMNRLLETAHFKNSRRYPALFRFMVEETLEGRGEFLKERLLGINVFGRPSDYDTAADPTVRVSVAEIRKRIAQYYHEEAHDLELRIDIQPGRYQPEFRLGRGQGYEPWRLPEKVGTDTEALELADRHSEPDLLAVADQVKRLGSVSKRVLFVCSAIFLIVLLSLAGLSWRWVHSAAISELWAPLLGTKGPIVVCIAGGTGAHDVTVMRALLHSTSEPAVSGQSAMAPTGSMPTFLNHMILDQNVVFADALAMTKIVDVLVRAKREYQIRLSGDTTLDDLRQGPSVLVGGLDNAWTLRVIARLRYRFDADNAYKCWITDSKNPAGKEWLLDLKKPYGAVNQDYAIVARVHAEQTGQPQIIVAGLGMSGTVAASELLVNPQLGKELRQRIGGGFQDRDFEAVVRTDVVNGIAGPPRILAVEVW
jgi:hypothetical protein